MSSSHAAPASWLASLRLAAAGAVVVDHAFLLTGHPTPVLLAWTGRELHLGGLAVLVFFVLSGYLVTSSWLAEPDLARFLRKRVLRIFPGLATVLLLSVLLLGPAVTQLPLAEYLSSGQTWSYLRGVLLAPIPLHLPGVFLDNPGTDYVNGSLWTLPLELIAYCLLGAAGLLGLVRRRWPLPALAAVLLVATQLVPVLSQSGLGDPLLFFALGASARVFPPPMGTTLAAGASGLLSVSVLLGTYTLGALALTYLILFLGTRTCGPLAHAGRWGDPSYGIYIYGYPVQQALVGAGWTSVWSMAATSVVLVVPLGYLSWHLVEKRAMTWGRRERAHATSTSEAAAAAHASVPAQRDDRLPEPAVPATTWTPRDCSDRLADVVRTALPEEPAGHHALLMPSHQVRPEQHESGAAVVEYAVLVALVGLVVAGAAVGVGDRVSTTYETACGALAQGRQSAPAPPGRAVGLPGAPGQQRGRC